MICNKNLTKHLRNKNCEYFGEPCCIYKQNLHTHTVLCDGKDTHEELIKKAISLGFDSLGFSPHSYMSFSSSPSLLPQNEEKYKNEIKKLKEKYRDKIEIFCGLEFEMYSECDLLDFDYVIGSTHYFKIGDEYIGYDRDAKTVKNIIDTYFSGDGMRFAKAYYENMCILKDKWNFDIIGHFDLITKNCELASFFDEDSKEYRSYAFEALHTLKEKFDVFEINTGAIARGYRKTPYPAPFILKEMKNIGCKMIISSDCHDKEFLNIHFKECIDLMKECGFKEVYKLTKNGFEATKI